MSSSILLDSNKKQAIFDYISEGNESINSDEFMKKFDNESLFIIRYLKHSLEENENVEVINLKEKMSSIYFEYLKGKEIDEKNNERTEIDELITALNYK